MSRSLKNFVLLPLLMVGFGLILPGWVAAQPFKTLHTFTALSGNSGTAGSGTNSDGANPYAGLILSGNTLYGTAQYGGTNGSGTVFAVGTNGAGFTVLHAFTMANNFSSVLTNSDGAFPYGTLLLSGNTLYGTALDGGTNGDGTVFAIDTNGTGFATLHGFAASSYPNFPYTNSDGAFPYAGLILSGATLYGTATAGGTNGDGTMFAIDTNDAGSATLHVFTNSDGASPYGGLLVSGDTLYGTATDGGTNGNGTVFAVNTNGAGFTVLHNFSAERYNGFSANTNGDGALPYAGLILSGTTLYGTASAGGINGSGTVFTIGTNGMGFTVLHGFGAVNQYISGGGPFTNSDGAFPYGGLILSGNTLYGTATAGDVNGSGTVFAIDTNGTAFTALYAFSSSYHGGTNGDGANPYAGLILSSNTLYGTAQYGGTNGNGTVFAFTLPPPPPQLAITCSGTHVILTWPANVNGFSYAGFTLDSSTSLVSAAGWTAVFPAPVILNGQNTVTNPLSGTATFYRLSQ